MVVEDGGLGVGRDGARRHRHRKFDAATGGRSCADTRRWRVGGYRLLPAGQPGNARWVGKSERRVHTVSQEQPAPSIAVPDAIRRSARILHGGHRLVTF